LLRLPILASVPLVRRGRRSRRGQPRGFELEAYEALSASIEFQLPPVKQRTLLVTSAIAGEGKTEVAARLGEALAEAGHPTLLIDGDLRRPSLHEFFHLQPGDGLRGLVEAVNRGDADGGVENILARSHLTDSLSVVSGAGRAAGPSRVLGRRDAPALFAELARRPFEYVLLDGPPLLGVVDAQILAQSVDAVLVVARLDRLTVENVHDLRELLDRQGIKALGIFVVGAEGAASYHLLDYLGGRPAVLEKA
jgi:receptor protein-tyrosine kinase